MTYDDYSTKCRMCGKNRGGHYSGGGISPVAFCTHKDLKQYQATGQISGPSFIPVDIKTVSDNFKIVGNARVVMVIGDSWAKEGQVGTVRIREGDTVRVDWDKGTCFNHLVRNLSLLSEVKDPNILFLRRKM